LEYASKGAEYCAMDAKTRSDTREDPIDLYDYCQADGQPARRRGSRRPKPKWTPKIVDDWPDEVLVFVEELELYEVYLGDDLDRILGIKK
jgi:hypothetical protein